MRLPLRLGKWGLVLATAVVGLAAPHRASADVITIHDGAIPGRTSIPFTCSKTSVSFLFSEPAFCETDALDFRSPIIGVLNASCFFARYGISIQSEALPAGPPFSSAAATRT